MTTELRNKIHDCLVWYFESHERIYNLAAKRIMEIIEKYDQETDATLADQILQSHKETE